MYKTYQVIKRNFLHVEWSMDIVRKKIAYCETFNVVEWMIRNFVKRYIDWTYTEWKSDSSTSEVEHYRKKMWYLEECLTIKIFFSRFILTLHDRYTTMIFQKLSILLRCIVLAVVLLVWLSSLECVAFRETRGYKVTNTPVTLK